MCVKNKTWTIFLLINFFLSDLCDLKLLWFFCVIVKCDVLICYFIDIKNNWTTKFLFNNSKKIQQRKDTSSEDNCYIQFDWIQIFRNSKRFHFADRIDFVATDLRFVGPDFHNHFWTKDEYLIIIIHDTIFFNDKNWTYKFGLLSWIEKWFLVILFICCCIILSDRNSTLLGS